MSRYWLTVLTVGLVLLLPVTAVAHGGGTDSQGGHYDGSGGYHFHHGYPAHAHWDMDGDGIVDCIYKFEDKTNHDSSGSSGGGSGSPTRLSYSDGYKDGYEKGYDDGVRDEKNAGHDASYQSGYTAGKKEAEITLEKEYQEKLDEKEGTVILSMLLLGGPVLIGLHFVLTTLRVAKIQAKHDKELKRVKEECLQDCNLAILRRVLPSEKEYVPLPKGVRLNVNCIPVKGSVDKNRPYGGFTVYFSANGTRYHERFGCSGADRPAHLFQCIGKMAPCKTCARIYRDAKLPDWYLQIMTGKNGGEEKKTTEPKPKLYAPQEPASTEMMKET